MSSDDSSLAGKAACVQPHIKLINDENERQGRSKSIAIASAQQTEKRVHMEQESKYTPARSSPPALCHIERQEEISEPGIRWADGYQMEISSRDEESAVEQ